MDYNARQELFLEHIEYFWILDKLGKGIMIKPHLEQYMSKFNDINKYKFNRDLDKLHKAKLLEKMKTKSVTIISVTSPSLMFLQNKKSVKEVSTSSVLTNRNLKMSIMKNEYIINIYLDKCKSYQELKALLDRTSLIAKTGDHEQLLKGILKQHINGTKQKSHNFKNLQDEITYIVDSKYNKALQITPPPLDKNGEEIPKVKREINFTRASINNLQARHIYFKKLGEFKSKKKEKGNIVTAADVDLIYMEVADLIGYQKFVRDMNIVSQWLISNIDFGKIKIEVVIEPNRRSAIEATIKMWQRKKINSFCTQDVEFKIVEVDVTNKHLKGVNISI